MDAEARSRLGARRVPPVRRDSVARVARTRAKRRPAIEAEPLGPEPGPTFAEELERQGLVEATVQRTRAVIAHSNAAAVEHARVNLKVISCLDCRAPKGCCWLVTGAYLHEGVAIAARLIDEGRDTPELRQALGTAAHEMETSDTMSYRRPCVFLGPDDRCTVYEDRPSVCGAHLVTSPAMACSDSTATTVSALVGTLHTETPRQVAEQFRASLSLPPLDIPYRGALPRMVLLCLEAWHRRDHLRSLAGRVRPAVHRYRWAIR